MSNACPRRAVDSIILHPLTVLQQTAKPVRVSSRIACGTPVSSALRTLQHNVRHAAAGRRDNSSGGFPAAARRLLLPAPRRSSFRRLGLAAAAAPAAGLLPAGQSVSCIVPAATRLLLRRAALAVALPAALRPGAV